MAKGTTELFEALTLLAKEKGISPELLIEKIQTALVIAIKKDYPHTENTKFDIDIAKGKFEVALLKTVVEEVTDEAMEISLEDARNISKRYNIGDTAAIKIDTKNFGRIAAQNAKQVIKQSIKEFERNQLVEQWGGLQSEAVSVSVTKVEPATGNATVVINDNEVTLFKSDQLPGDDLKVGDIIKVFVYGVSAKDKRPTLRVSRTQRDLIKRLFELEVPEIYEGVVEIKSISREAGSRSKIAVMSNDENVDALGACIGPQRSRIAKICEELKGEKIDVVKYSDDPKEFIKQALKPADVLSVEIPDEEVRACSVVVPDNQLSLAIGNKGQNAKLAARLTGFKIDIKPESGFYQGE
ncbi:MAG: transcription termination/antitermination protein NusA [Ruminiclostridium sp.]|nr:transcription termination/antitermination protein NusA [Ruminiclostridium sp.]MBQ8410446.1 transcription termination/antitermination protein NusA [Ruminiclostridium sp.]MBQ8842201.1 transcription termination/antitermination protein NusA [Ruminiclostridium sp.]